MTSCYAGLPTRSGGNDLGTWHSLCWPAMPLLLERALLL